MSVDLPFIHSACSPLHHRWRPGCLFRGTELETPSQHSKFLRVRGAVSRYPCHTMSDLRNYEYTGLIHAGCCTQFHSNFEHRRSSSSRIR